MKPLNSTTQSATIYPRASEILVNNTLGSDPIIRFREETAFVLGDKTICEPAGYVELPFDPTMQIDIIDPTSEQPTGQTITVAEAMAIAFSMWLKARELRDKLAEGDEEEEIEDEIE